MITLIPVNLACNSIGLYNSKFKFPKRFAEFEAAENFVKSHLGADFKVFSVEKKHLKTD